MSLTLPSMPSARRQRPQALAPTVLINASGPFQDQDYRLARACIAAGWHYIDLADARAFVTGIGILDAEARAANVSVVSGASSVPGLSSAVVRRMAQDLAQLDEVHIGISPGNSFDPGVATAASIIGQAGKPFLVRRAGAQVAAYGWQGLHRHRFPEIGARWMSDVDVPDLELLPQNYPELSTARFCAGLEVGAFHLGLWTASFLVRAGVVRNLRALATPMLAVKRRLSAFGSDTGGMFVRVVGRDHAGTRRACTWHLIARSGDGPYVPAMASVILAKRLVAGEGLPAWRQALLRAVHIGRLRDRGRRPRYHLLAAAAADALRAGDDLRCRERALECINPILVVHPERDFQRALDLRF